MEENYEISFQIIAEAGDARNKALEAIEEAEAGRFEEAEELLKEANICINKAHKFQTDLIFQETNGQKVDMNIILVHSQDHFAMAMSAIDMAKYAIRLYRRLDKLEG